MGVKGTVSRDFLLLVFFINQFPPPQSIPLGPFRIFSKIRGDIRNSRLTTGVIDVDVVVVVVVDVDVDTSGK
jgi:hypothetical protein